MQLIKLFSMNNIKNVVFDMGGVLVDLDREACIREYNKIGYTEADKLLDPYVQTGIFLELEKGTITPQDLHAYIQRSCPEATGQMIDEALFAFVTGLPQSKLDMLLSLRKRYNVYMLSNTNEIMFPYIEQKWFSTGGHTIDDYFDRLFLSYKMGVVKPGKEIFEMMTGQGNMIPEQTLFIDDATANVATAQELGFRTYLAAPNEDLNHLFA